MNKNPKFSHLSVYKFKPGQSGNVNGRPKSYVTVLKELGYTKPVIATMAAELMFMTKEELWQVARSERVEPVIRVGIARAFYSYACRGNYKDIADIMNILFGRHMPFIPEAPTSEDKELE